MKRVLLLVGRLLLAGIFLYAGYAKIREPWVTFASQIYTFKLVPDDRLELVARTLPWCELVLGVALLTGIFQRWFALIASLVLVVFLSALVHSYVLGLDVDCGCFGTHEPLGPMTILRDSTMLMLALAVTIGAFRMRRGGRRYA